MNRRDAVLAILAPGVALLAAPIASFAQQPTKLVRIGVLTIPSASSWAGRTDALRAGLRDFGYVEGRNTIIEFRSAEGRFDRLPELAADLVRRNVDVIVAGGTPAIRAAKQATNTIPIVIAAVGDAVAGGLVASLSRPGGNITGSTYFAPELAAKQLELLKEAFPQTTQIAVVVNPSNPSAGPSLRAVKSAARSLKLQLREFAVREPRDFEAAFVMIAKTGYRIALIIDDPITISNARELAALAVNHRLATGANFIEYAQAGGLTSYGVDLNVMWRRAAFFVDKILKDTSPGEIPVERSTRFELVINSKTAKAIGVTIAPSILVRADRVIE